MVQQQRPNDWNASFARTCASPTQLAGRHEIAVTEQRITGQCSSFGKVLQRNQSGLAAWNQLCSLQCLTGTGPTSWPSPTASHQDLCELGVAAFDSGRILGTLPAASEQLSPLAIDEHVTSLGDLLLAQRSSRCIFEQKESREQHNNFQHRSHLTSTQPFASSMGTLMAFRSGGSLKNLGTDFMMQNAKAMGELFQRLQCCSDCNFVPDTA